MNYRSLYFRLIERARLRDKPEGYFERHHVLPKCMGGGDEAENIIKLTGREHFIAHFALAKWLGGRKHWAAVIKMGFQTNQRSSRLYQIARGNCAAANRGDNNHMRSEEHRIRQGLQIAANHPMKRPEVAAKHSKFMTGENNPAKSFEARKAMSLAGKGKPKSEEHKAAIRAAYARKKQQSLEK